MIFVLATALIAAATSLLTPKKSIASLQGVAIAFLVFFPNVFSGAILNSKSGETWVNLPSVFAFIIGTVALARTPAENRTNLAKNGLYLLFIGISLASIFTIFGAGRAGIISLFNTILGPMLLALSIANSLRNSILLRQRLEKWIISLSIFQAILALLQFALRDNLLFSEMHSRFQTWFSIGNYSRSQGTLDHPLVLGSFLLLGLSLVLWTRSNASKWALSFLLMSGILVTQSRSALILATILLLFSVFLARRVNVFASVLLSAVGGLFLWSLPVVQAAIYSLVGKSFNDFGSTQARLDSLDYFANNIAEFLLGGHGFTASFSLKSSSILNTTLENGPLMWLYDLGLPAVLCILAGFVLFVSPLNVSWVQVVPMAITAASLSYSSVAVSPLATLTWFVALIYAGKVGTTNAPVRDSLNSRDSQN